MPRRSNRLTPNRPSTPQPQPPPEINPSISTVQLEEIISQRIVAALSNVTRDGVRNEGHVGTTRTCTYKDFMNCGPKSFHGNEGVVNLTRWIEKKKSIFQISFCPDNCKVRFAACTFADATLTWWKSHVNTMGIDIANSMKWEELKIMLVEEYCPRVEIHKLEQELWTLTMKGLEIKAYTARFNDLAVMCPTLVTPEYKKIERYIWGLASQIKGMVIASKPTTYDSTKRIAHQLTLTEIQGIEVISKDESPKSRSNKCKFNKKNPKQSSEKRQEVATNYATTTRVPTQPKSSWYNQCNRQHPGDCFVCMKCKKKGHTASYCRSTTPATVNQQTNNGTGRGEGRKCYECGEVGHIKKAYPKLRSQGGIGRGRVFVIGSGEAIQDPSVVSGTFLIDNLYATILFDSGADRSFITPTFRKLLSHKPSRLKEIYEVEIANGQSEKTHEILEKCLLTLNNYLFHVNLMPMPIGSFDVIIGMNWLSSQRAEILCHEKAIRLPLPNGEALIIYGDKSRKNLKVISCTKTHKYVHRKCSAFLAHIVDRKRKTK
ncbi:uncharacterized protein LOC111911512 [Lactuca sativa]|uniref:uncharacterized protein LOC111911512 n=1 Tax=Lactuca sativa TaxID=4236 RepID=UPI000CD8575C|nr:uncharacterized protein LOC111911512 [Lactuca sativa]